MDVYRFTGKVLAARPAAGRWRGLPSPVAVNRNHLLLLICITTIARNAIRRGGFFTTLIYRFDLTIQDYWHDFCPAIIMPT